MFYTEQHRGVIIYKSDLLPVPHGFSTRCGGVSSQPATRSLNLGTGRGDDDETVTENRRLFADACGFPPPYPAKNNILTSARQIHSDIIEYIDGSNADAAFVCDGFITQTPRVPIAVKTADCVPVLLYAAKSNAGNIAAALHSGWRGTAAGIAAVAVESMVRLGVAPENIYAAVGPHIGAECFIVSDDFGDMFYAIASASHSRVHAAMAGDLTSRCGFRGDDGKLRFDLTLAVVSSLSAAGVPSSHIDTADLCTVCSPDEFYSHRRDGEARGVMMSAVMLV